MFNLFFTGANTQRARRTRRTIIAGICGGLFLSTFSARGSADMPAGIAKLLAQYRIPQAAVSIEVRPLVPAGQPAPPPILSVHPRRPRNPASVAKLVTTLAALEILGADHRWQTEYLASGDLQPGRDGGPGRLRGDLILRGGGDPLLTVEQLFTHILELRATIAAVDGMLIIDNGKFAAADRARGAFDGQSTRLYNVAPDAALLNFSAANFTLTPHDGPRDREIRVTVSPPLAGLKIINEIKPRAGRCINRNAGWNYHITRRGDQVIAHFRGQYRARCGMHTVARAPLPNAEYACRLFTALWRRSGGDINDCRAANGPAQGAPPDADAQILLTRESRPLAEIIAGINKFSNNVMARMLLLTLGEQSLRENDTADFSPPPRRELRARGRAVIGAWLAANNITMPALKLDNGAGLSRRSRATARGLSELLRHGWRSVYRPEFLASMPLAAMDGTMRSRLHNTPLRARARMKTGLISGVRSMAGVVQAADDRHYSVVMLIDSRRVNFWNGNKLQDALLKWVYDRP